MVMLVFTTCSNSIKGTVLSSITLETGLGKLYIWSSSCAVSYTLLPTAELNAFASHPIIIAMSITAFSEFSESFEPRFES